MFKVVDEIRTEDLWRLKRPLYQLSYHHSATNVFHTYIFFLGEAYCEARLIYDGLEIQPGQSLGDLYQGFEKYSISGLPMPLPDKPLITQMSDTHVTLTWKPGEFSL